MSNQTTPAALLFDRRLLDRNLRKGYLTQAEVDAQLATLPDSTDNAAKVAASLHDAPEPEVDDLDDDEEDIDDDEG